MNVYLWLIRREFWENRAIWLLPAVVSALLLIIALFGKMPVGEASLGMSPEQIRTAGPMILFGLGSLALFAIMSVYTTWYLLDCLHTERKDRSVLFWKSLPVSDMATVLSKLAMGLIIIPLVYFAAADLTALGAAFILSVRAGTPFVAALWQLSVWAQLQVLWIYVIFSTAMWYLPFTGWFLLVSSWAKRAVALWALLAPLVLCYVEINLLGSNHVWKMLISHTVGFLPTAFHDQNHFSARTAFDADTPATGQAVWELINPVGLLASPETWIGMAVGLLFVAGAIVLRRRYTET